MRLGLHELVDRTPARSTANPIVVIHLHDVMVPFSDLVLEIRYVLFWIGFSAQIADLQPVAIIEALGFLARNSLAFVDAQT